METKKVLGIIFSILFICAFGFVLSWGIINFNKVKDGMSGTGVYTKDDVDKAYKDGYSTALDNEKSYTELIDSYRDTITAQTDQISQLNSQVTVLTNSNKDYTQQIINLESQKVSLEEQVDNLSTIKTNNETTINDLTSQIVILQKEVSDLQNSNYNYSQEIAQKNSQISNLQNSVLQLQKTNELNVETINNLNSQITNLNSQISEMSLQIQNNSANVSYLNNKISELEQSVSYYERYISSLENGEQVVATFEFNGSVYSIQIVAPNSTLSVTNPSSTDYVIFNYWTVDGDRIDLSTYKITKNTKIVADVTQKYDVKFMVDNTEFNKQLVVKNGNVVLPSNPTKNGYEFDGWTINGVDIIDPTTININSNTTFIAKFTKIHTVTFVLEDSTYNTQNIRNGDYASNVIVDSTVYKKFNGWTINGAIVDLSTYKIVADTTVIASITYSYDVSFIVDGISINNQIVLKDNYSIIPNQPTKSGYEFKGWSLNGIDIVEVSNISITSNTQFIAIFERRLGFADEFTKINHNYVNSTNMNYMFDIDDNTFLMTANGYTLYFVDKQTYEVTEQKFEACNNLVLYNNKLYGSSSSYYGFNVFDLSTKISKKLITASTLETYGFKSSDTKYIKCDVHNGYIYLFGDSSSGNDRCVIINLNTLEVKNTIVLSSKNYDGHTIIDNYLYIGSYYSSTEICQKINLSTFTVETTFDYSSLPYEIDNTIYWDIDNVVNVYNPSNNNFTATDISYNWYSTVKEVNGIYFIKYKVSDSRQSLGTFNPDTFEINENARFEQQFVYYFDAVKIDDNTLLIYQRGVNANGNYFILYYI